MALADDAVDAVDDPDRLDATLEHGEERALVALVRGVLARGQADVGGDARQPLAVGGLERSEDRDLRDLVRRHHEGRSSSAARRRATSSSVL